MVMTRKIPCSTDIYYNTQIWFARNILPGLPNDNNAWARAYSKWMLGQGAVVERSDRDVIRNGIGIAPGYDYLVFDRDEDLTMFALRWS
jgi:hypothetical protein